MYDYDVIVVGAGHAGVEVANAPAVMGKKVLLLTISLDSIAMMPCNPSIGGTGKGHLVKEVDALGGLMGLNTDKVTIQSKTLNRTKGPAVHSLRVQTDKFKYHDYMKRTLEDIENIDIKQAEVSEVLFEGKKAVGVKTLTGMVYTSKTVILATGTYLAAKIFIGSNVIKTGPNGLKASEVLSDSLEKEGISFRRFKTGTPARVHYDTIDFSKVTLYLGDENPEPFSFLNDEIVFNEEPCYLAYTNEKTHEVINHNIHLSAMYGGQIEGTGPRYCPSIEDKISRFDRPRHQLFLEPEGLGTKEIYVQGMSTSLPESIQIDFLRTIEGLEHVEIMRPGYAIEYDCIDPTLLKLTLESKEYENLFFAGQINGSSGYEEAAAQGIIAGINASLKIDGKEEFILKRNEAYIGVLIDDLVTKGTNEPFRMMTSRAEYRLILRQDNADIRLTEKAYQLGLASEERYHKMLDKKRAIAEEMDRIKSTLIPKDEINTLFSKLGLSEVGESMYLYDLLRRTDLNYEKLKELDSSEVSSDIKKYVEVEVKYSGYIEKEMRQIKKFESLENKKIPDDIVYEEIKGLRIEAMQKLSSNRPYNLGQASRISGVNPADISVLLVYMEMKRRSNEKRCRK